MGGSAPLPTCVKFREEGRKTAVGWGIVPKKATETLSPTDAADKKFVSIPVLSVVFSAAGVDGRQD